MLHRTTKMLIAEKASLRQMRKRKTGGSKDTTDGCGVPEVQLMRFTGCKHRQLKSPPLGFSKTFYLNQPICVFLDNQRRIISRPDVIGVAP
ncbi:hypothetical protein [Teichococcus rhizosphaerae]|uniref:hypothetical protein n=1 Tax=Teichococcus rhizosphaerae TaxID=1335062 RepID=UPI001145F945|nr:hypothetical protein [Pseudoroseomonas rhizosphaerae]